MNITADDELKEWTELIIDCMTGLSLCAPTEHLPGTPEKIVVLSRRARGRQSLHHPLDANPVKQDRVAVGGWRDTSGNTHRRRHFAAAEAG